MGTLFIGACRENNDNAPIYKTIWSLSPARAGAALGSCRSEYGVDAGINGTLPTVACILNNETKHRDILAKWDKRYFIFIPAWRRFAASHCLAAECNE